MGIESNSWKQELGAREKVHALQLHLQSKRPHLSGLVSERLLTEGAIKVHTAKMSQNWIRKWKQCQKEG